MMERSISWQLPDDLLDELVVLLADRIARKLTVETQRDSWLDTRRAAEYLSIPISSLQRLSAANKVPHVQDTPGGRKFYRQSWLDEWRESNARGLQA